MRNKYKDELAQFSNLDWVYIEKLINRITQQIFTDYDLIPEQRTIRLSNSKGCHHQIHNPKSHMTHEFHYGKKSLAHKFIYGFNEYKSIASRIQGALPKPSGLKATYYVIIHENAHALQWKRNGRSYRSIHNQVFVDAMNELLDRYPYQQVCIAILGHKIFENFTLKNSHYNKLKTTCVLPIPKRVVSAFAYDSTACDYRQQFVEQSAGSNIHFDRVTGTLSYIVTCEGMTWGQTTYNKRDHVWFFDNRNFRGTREIAAHAMNAYLNS